MAAIHVRLSSVQALAAATPDMRSRMLTAESVLSNAGALRVRISVVESVLAAPAPALRARFNAVEAIVDHVSHPPALRSRLLVVEALQAVLEPFMSNLLFPTSLPGLAFDVNKKPVFSTKVAEHVSGEETATSFFQNPKWEFKLTYDYLPDIPKSVGDTDLHTIMGLFLQMRGRGDTFLFHDPDDYACSDGWQLDFDGVTAQFKMVRAIGAFYEPIGQLDTSVVPLQVWLAVSESFSVPAFPGPYTHTVTHAAAYAQTDSVTINAVAATKVTGVPTTGQYAVVAGVYTFAAADAGKAVVVRYRWLLADPADYTVTMPNVITLATAPTAGSTAYTTFNYQFVCRFLEDSSEYTKFMDKLWNLSELGFRSIPQ